ncbi:MAG: aminomethyl-transferring glycine dehydrogenase subunit GcvPA [Candidatus Wallbacteria bacterium]|nr:aminomethyl-transferring glycine dehydrogenase subunit GcvPA [Candidatus Wallbacteria bacterium]
MTHPYIPLTAAEESKMLQACGLASVEQLFECIPEPIRKAFQVDGLPPGPLSEPAIVSELTRLAGANWACDRLVTFLGGGAYDHHVPSIIPSLLFRSEFATAYTPYQPEVSQGTLQAIFEFQTLVCNLTGLEIANASMYDGATAAAEAALMACGANGRDQVLLSSGVHPSYRDVVGTYLRATDREATLVELDTTGQTPHAAVAGADVAALVVGYPNYFGVIESLAALRRALDPKALLVVVANPIALGLFAAPGACGADVVVGEGMPLGAGLNYGGPGLGFMAVKESLMRRIPGRLVGMARDHHGRSGYVLTLQAREQHIRRARAASNICTNQALAALASTIYMCTLGRQGMIELAKLNYHKAHYAFRALEGIEGVRAVFPSPFFNEFAIRLPREPRAVLERLEREDGIAGGIELGGDYKGLEDALLIAVTEKRTRQEIDRLVAGVRRSVK